MPVPFWLGYRRICGTLSRLEMWSAIGIVRKRKDSMRAFHIFARMLFLCPEEK